MLEFTASPLSGPVDLSLTGRAATLQRIALILATPLGSLPLDRGFGVDYRFVDRPPRQAAAALRADVVRAIRRSEPLAEVKAVSFTHEAASGRLIPHVTIALIDE